MKKQITRRDFLNGTQIAIGASLVSPWVLTYGAQAQNIPLGKEYYPPAKTGLRGSHEGSWENMHARVMGEEWNVDKVDEEVDLVIVGGGIGPPEALPAM